MLVRIVALWLIGAPSSLLAQEAFNNGLPQPQSAPSWVDAVNMAPTVEINGASAKTIFRIRIAHPPGDYQVLYFRLFFDDNSNARPELVAWDELGTQVLRSGKLGSGVGLPTSDSVMIPMSGI